MTSTTVSPPVAGEPGPHLGSSVSATDDVTRSASLHISGELCAITAAAHARQIQELFDLGYVDLRIELDGLQLCTSDGLDLWDDTQHRLGDVGGGLTLSGATGLVRRVLEVMTSSATHFCPTVLPAA